MAKLGIHPYVADAVLNHKSGTISGVAAVYQRYRYGDEARHALKAWDTHVSAIVKGVRHSFEDRLTAVEPPDKVQAALMGHKYARPRYGDGPNLEQKKKWLDAICFDVL